MAKEWTLKRISYRRFWKRLGTFAMIVYAKQLGIAARLHLEHEAAAILFGKLR